MGAPRQLSERDAGFLFTDTGHTNSNLSLLHIYDQSTAPGGKVRFKSILAHIESRLDRTPMFRQRLLQVPFGLDYPHWVDDEDFDLEYHVRHIALPKPGDWRQFCIQVSRIHARPLDLSRPLWEIYVIEGLDQFVDLPPGSFALLIKVHLAAIDLGHGGEISTLLHDFTPQPSAPEPPAPWFPEQEPAKLALMLRGLFHVVVAPSGLGAPLARAAAVLSRVALSFAGDAMLSAGGMAITRFNSIVSPQRVFDTRRFELEQFNAIRALVPGATVNDAVLAVCGGAFRRFFEAEDELPATSLSAMAPIQRRGTGRAAHKPKFAWLSVKLGTDIEDSVERLRRIREQTALSASESRKGRGEDLADIERHVPIGSLALTGRLLGQTMLAGGRRAPLANCMITDVPGPAVPMYLIGARMTYFSAIMPIYDGMGLVLAVTSYDGKVIVSPTACRELLPDPEAFSQCIRDSFQEYLALATRTVSRQAVKPAKRTAAHTGKQALRPRTARKAATRPPAARAGRPRSRTPAD